MFVNLTPEQRARFNGLLASIPMSHPYQLVIDSESGMVRVTGGDNPSVLEANKNHPLREGEELLLVHKTSMQLYVPDDPLSSVAETEVIPSEQGGNQNQLRPPKSRYFVKF